MAAIQNLRFAVRRLIKSPLFTLIAVLSVAAGIGINSAVFSLVNGIVLSSLPYKDAERLVLVVGHHPQIGRFSASYPDFLDLKEKSKSFEYFAGFQQKGFTVMGNESPEKFRGLIVSADFFPMLGVTPALGRVFLSQEEMGQGAPVVVLSYALWRDWFGADKNIVGQNITINSVSYTVIGVTPANFRPPVGGRFWLPLQVPDEAKADRGIRFLRILAKLKPGVTIEQAQAELSLIGSQIEQQYPTTNAGRQALVIPLQNELAQTDRRSVLLTLGAVAFVLLITCLNLANLFMARALTRAKEIGIRTALGASRMHVAMQFLTESMLLTLIGGALGLLFSLWARDIMLAALAVSPLFRTNLDIRIILFTVGITFLTGLLSALIPAIRILRIDPLHTLKEGGSSGLTPSRRSLIKNLISVEVGLALALTVGAILMFKSFVALQNVDLGFSSDNLIAMNISLPEKKYDTPDKQTDFFAQVLQRVKALPGAQQATVVSLVPLFGSLQASKFSIEGKPSPPDEEINRAGFHIVSPEYFSTMKIPLISGRVFTEQDGKTSQPVAVISQKMARRFWPDEDPINRRFSTEDEANKWITIVGVVGDVKYLGLTAESDAEYYLPFLQSPRPGMAVIVRGSNPTSLIKQMRSSVFAVDKNQPLDNIQTMDEILDDQLRKPRSLAKVIGLFGVTALLLAGLGIYGITAYSVKQRTREVGIRMALGAGRFNVLALIVRQSLVHILIGIVAGVVGAGLLTRAISGVLYGVQPNDMSTYLVAALILLTTGIAASYIPARKAAMVDPVTALRDE